MAAAAPALSGAALAAYRGIRPRSAHKHQAARCSAAGKRRIAKAASAKTALAGSIFWQRNSVAMLTSAKPLMKIEA